MAVIEAPEKVEVTIPDDMVVPDNVKDVLRKARDLISLGWTQNQMHMKVQVDGSVGHSYCMLGAIYEASRRQDGLANIRNYSSYIESVLGTGVIDFNDQPHRKKEHVLAVFDELIAK
jgi:hypothetical protein